MSIESLYEEAMDLFNNNKILQSKELFLKIVDMDNNYHQAINMLGFILNLEGDSESSSRYIKKAVELAPSESRYRNNLGVVYLETLNYDEALNEFLEAVKYDSFNSEAHCNIGYVKYKKGEFEDARGFFEKAVQLNPDNFIAFLYGAALYRDMNLLSNALGFYTRVLEINPNFIEAYKQRANLQFELRMYNEALADYKKVLELNPNLADAKLIRGTINQIYSQLFPLNRFSFYNDKSQLNLYKEVIEKLTQKDIKLLEFSNVEGILSMLFAKNGINDIDLVIKDPFLMYQAKELIDKNRLGESIHTIQKDSNELIDGKDISEKCDILVTDLFHEGFPLYRDFLNIQNLKRYFLKESGTIFPFSLKLFIQPLYCEELHQKKIASDVLGLDVSSLDQFRSYYTYEKLADYKYELLGEANEVYNFELAKIPEKKWKKSIPFKVQKNTTCHGFVVWVDKWLDREICIDNSPLNKKELYHYVYLLDEPKKLQKDQELKIDIDYGDFPIISI